MCGTGFQAPHPYPTSHMSCKPPSLSLLRAFASVFSFPTPLCLPAQWTRSYFTALPDSSRLADIVRIRSPALLLSRWTSCPSPALHCVLGPPSATSPQPLLLSRVPWSSPHCLPLSVTLSSRLSLPSLRLWEGSGPHRGAPGLTRLTPCPALARAPSAITISPGGFAGTIQSSCLSRFSAEPSQSSLIAAREVQGLAVA